MYTPSEPDPLHQLLLQNMTPDGIPTLPKDNATLLKAVLHSNSPLLRTAAAKLVSTAENGSPSEQQVAGMIYFLGLGLEPNPEKAAQWFLKAARRGNANAQCRLAECYDYGIGLSQDHPLAAYWYTKAATQGETPWPSTSLASSTSAAPASPKTPAKPSAGSAKPPCKENPHPNLP